MTTVLENFETYTTSLAEFAAAPTEVTAEQLQQAQADVADMRIYPRAYWDLSKGFKTLEGDPDAIFSVWEDGKEGRYVDANASLRRQSRAGLIGYGMNAPFSGALDQADLPEFYEIVTEGLDVLGNADKRFTNFAFRAMRREVQSRTLDTYLGYNFAPMPRAEAIRMGKSSLDIIGYHRGFLGKLLLKSSEIMYRDPANKTKNPNDK